MSADPSPTPLPAVGAIVFREGAVLLVRRGRPPAVGEWAIPGGRLHWGESLQAAAEREVLEETGIRIRAREPVFAFDLIQADTGGDCRLHYVIVDLEADYLEGEPRAADDAIDARWVRPEELAELPVNATTRRLLRERYGME